MGRTVPYLLALVALAATLRAELLTARSLWIDEALSLDIAAGGPSNILAISARAEPHPPGFYLLLWAWTRVFGDGVIAARTLSFVFGIACAPLTWLLGRQVFGEQIGRVAALLVAIHPFQIFAANEIRMYTLLTSTSLLTTLAFASALRRGEGVKHWVGLGVSLAAVAYTSYYGFPFLLANLLLLLRIRRTSRSAPWLTLSSFLVCYLPWLPFLPSSGTSNPVPWRPAPDWLYPISILSVQTFGGYLLGAPAYHGGSALTWGWVSLVIPFGLLLGLGARSAWRHGVAGELVVLSWAVPVSSALVGSVILGKIVAYNYHLTYVQPYAGILLGLGAAEVGRRFKGRAAVLIVSATLVAVLALGAREVQRGSREVYRFDLLARWLHQHRGAGDVTIYFTATGARVLARYLARVGPEIEIAPSPHRWTLVETRPLLMEAVRPLGSKHRRVWLILTPPFPAGSVEELLRLLEQKGYRTAGNGVSFGGIFAQLLER